MKNIFIKHPIYGMMNLETIGNSLNSLGNDPSTNAYLIGVVKCLIEKVNDLSKPAPLSEIQEVRDKIKDFNGFHYDMDVFTINEVLKVLKVVESQQMEINNLRDERKAIAENTEQVDEMLELEEMSQRC